MSNNQSNQSLAFCFSGSSPISNKAVNHTVASAYFSAVFSALGLSSNLFALVVLVKAFHQTKSRSRSSFLLFLCGLVVTDFMGLLVTGTIVVSFHVTHFDWMLLDPNCHFCNFMGMSMVFYGLCPLLLGATMAVERFVGINWPFARSANISKSRACYMVFGVWVSAGFISLLPLLGLGSYHIQVPGSWCFLNISHMPLDMAFCLIFSLVGLLSLAVSFVLNTVSVVTLLRVCCGQDSSRRRRDYELEMMVQLILIMVIASICWCPLLIYIMMTVLSAASARPDFVLLCLRMATINQICDPWIYILCQESKLRCLLHKLCFRRASSTSPVSCSGFALPRGTRSWTLGSTSSSVVPY
ncbi:thromboxane A2 receptor isoform X2 [Astyanax mexicanus]|uniref:thromboxane A2 receptor isoform X2 n=1 Tax=Astyanax mexicanus TaxID=7994 RepID=UPI0020CB4E94|nr:thromboxane A2 receptor isoform X2 [Astyanax mexicanus]